MDIRAAIKGQYHSSLTMLREAIEVCPAELWTAGTDRAFWRIAYHALYYGHWYLGKDITDFDKWKGDWKGAAALWAEVGDGRVMSQEEMLEYWEQVSSKVDSGVDGMDLEAGECGFSWYTMPKLEHQLLSIRHIQQHVGQLSELLMGVGVEVTWV